MTDQFRFTPHQTDLVGLLTRIADAMEILIEHVEIGSGPASHNDHCRLEALAAELRAYATDVELSPVDVAIDEALSDIGLYASWKVVGRSGSASGQAEIYCLLEERSLHVVGASSMAERLRERLRSNTAAGWTLHPVPTTTTPIRVLYDALRHERGGTRAINALKGHCFATVEEVIATPEDALSLFTNIGQSSCAVIRKALKAIEADMVLPVSSDAVEKLLIVVDVQNGFVNDHSRMVVQPIANFLKKWLERGDTAIVTRFYNPPGSKWEQLVHWCQVRERPETDLVREIADAIGPFRASKQLLVVDKTSYSSLTAQVRGWIDALGSREIYICGIATDACVLKTAVDVFEYKELRPYILVDLCASEAGESVHEAGLLLAGRYIGTDQMLVSGSLQWP